MRKGTAAAAAEAYLKFLYTDDAQEIIARHFYRPEQPGDPEKAATDAARNVDLFPVTVVAKDWGEAQKKFFAEGGVFDAIYQPHAH